ncbi:MAG: nucleotidyl transferase AbiEii/AbiGii toxin family protein [Bacteroidaceae bacterium]|nr:nucleotidyl transferase AbiEii/AbiGii toxin family protein [Bacteroidaceae bacterium]
MKGLAPRTQQIFEAVSTLDCIKPYLLVGGTALSLQINTRQSEDLDFMKWRTSREERPEVDWSSIEKELNTIGEIQHRDILDIDHVEFLFEGVKLSFYSSPKCSPVKSSLHLLNNIYLADIISIGAMKMEVMLRRTNFRDYYDIYSILKTGVAIHEIIALALEYSGHRLRTKNLLAILTNGQRFERDSRIHHLQPKYQISAQEIESYIKDLLATNRDISFKQG